MTTHYKHLLNYNQPMREPFILRRLQVKLATGKAISSCLRQAFAFKISAPTLILFYSITNHQRN
jgi:hypothetical protein